MKLTLPPQLSGQLLFRRGALIKLTIEFDDGTTREKYGIAVNVDEAGDPVLLILTTTNLRWYDEHPDAVGFVRAPAGTIQSLPRDSVINCRTLHQISREKIAQDYQSQLVTYCEQLPAAVLSEIDSALADTAMLSPADKAKVVPNHAPASSRGQKLKMRLRPRR